TSGTCKKEKDISKESQPKLEHSNLGAECCKLCGKSVANIKKHMKSHFPDKYQCQICMISECAPLTYIEKVNLSDFFEKLPYTYTSKCKLCGRVVSNLKNHYLTHNPGNYVCPLCGCRRTRLDNLKVHIKQKHPDVQILQMSSGTNGRIAVDYTDMSFLTMEVSIHVPLVTTICVFLYDEDFCKRDTISVEI
ncbi:unnamed protein product, partial [Heterotrigona itama]